MLHAGLDLLRWLTLLKSQWVIEGEFPWGINGDQWGQ